MTAPMSSPLRAYIDQTDELPFDILLGRIVLFTITDEPVAHADVKKWFTELRLDERYLPALNKAQDAFKKATSEAKNVYPMSKGREGHCLSRDVNSSSEYVRRQITREIKDSRNKVLSYERAIDCTFYKPTDARDQSTSRLHIQVNEQVLEAGELDAVKTVAQGIWTRFYRYFHYLDGQKLRATVRGYLKHLNAIEIKGGVYFVHASRDAELSALAELISRFGGDCQMNTLPIVDLERERTFITQVFEREASQALNDLTKETRTIMESRGSVSMATYDRMRARYDEVLNNATEHMATLRVSQDVTAAAAELAQAELLRLQEKALQG